MGNTFERQTDKINNFELDISDGDFKEICDKFIQIYFFKDFKILLEDYIKGCEDIREKLKPKKIVIFPGDSPSKIYLYLKNTSSEEKKKNMINFSLSGMKYFKI